MRTELEYLRLEQKLKERDEEIEKILTEDDWMRQTIADLLDGSPEHQLASSNYLLSKAEQEIERLELKIKEMEKSNED